MVKKKMKKQTGLTSPSPSLLSLFIVSAFVSLFAIMTVTIPVQSEEIRMLISFLFANQAKAQQEQIQQSPPESPSSSPSPSTPTSDPSSLPPDIQQQQQPASSSSVKTLPLVVQTLVSKINTTLNDATTAAIKSVGDNNSNSLAIGTFLEADIDGGLVYKVFILDPDSPENLNILTLDPSNGRVLTTAQLPAPGILSGMVVPPAGGVGGSGGGNIIGSAPLPGG
jgi:hypothetical protein